MGSVNAALASAQRHTGLLQVALFVGIMSASARGQGADPDLFKVTRSSSKTVFQTSTGLLHAARAISEEYGWTVDYEEGASPLSDLEDIASPEWKAAHPFQVGVLVPKDEDISVEVPNDHPLRESYDKLALMQSLVRVSLPNRKNRARSVQSEPDGRTTIIDAQPAVQPIGSYEISEEAGAINGMFALGNIVDRCSAASGHKLGIGMVPVNLLGKMTFQRPGGRFTCRTAINQLLDAAPYKLSYAIMSDLGTSRFFLNIQPVMHTTISPSGELKKLVVRNALP